MKALIRRLARVFTRNIRTQAPGQMFIVADDWSNVLMGCCDCGLMHKFEFSIDERRRLVIRGWRDPAATHAIRTARHFHFVPRDSTSRQTPAA